MKQGQRVWPGGATEDAAEGVWLDEVIGVVPARATARQRADGREHAIRSVR